jgi:FkbM family methyltransferase
MKRMRTFLRSLPRWSGFDIVRHVPDVQHPFAVLPYLVKEAVESGEPFFFVQVGASDGLLDDPLRPLILRYALPGLLIEPLPDVYDRLVRNYAGQTQLRFENVAVAAQPGSFTIYRVRGDAPLSPYVQLLASHQRSHLLKEGIEDRYIEALDVPAMTLDQVLARHGIRRVTLLVVDAEGYDDEIVRSALTSGLRPRIIHYEHCHLVPRVRVEAKRLLQAHGYRFLEVGEDTLAVRSEEADEAGG